MLSRPRWSGTGSGRQTAQTTFAVRTAFDTLTPREKEVMALVTTGLMNKQIAAEIGLSEITVKIHRGHLMRKMGARSIAELVRMADLIVLRPQIARGGRARQSKPKYDSNN